MQNNPEVQWHLKHIKREDEEFKEEMKDRYKEAQRKRRVKRREYIKKYKDEELSKLKPEERQAKLEKEQKRREKMLIKEQELFEQVLTYQQRNNMPPHEEYYLRKMIRKDVKEIQKMEDMGEDDWSDEEGEQRLEDKVMYGTDSESDNELLAAQLLRQ